MSSWKNRSFPALSSRDLMKPDLHLHTNRSDGVLEPELLLHECIQAGLTVMAVTDHDTMAGSDMLSRMDTPIPVIPAVELSMSDMHGLHILAYGLSEGTLLREKLSYLTLKREERAEKMIRKLDEMGMHISFRQLQEKRRLEGGREATIGRPHIARALVRGGFCRNMQDAFARYIGAGKPAYIAAERMSIREALPLIRHSGFIPVLAHPRELKMEDQLLEAFLDRLCELGLMGMEVYHPSCREDDTDTLRRMAESRGLLVTGGSDFHQDNDRKHGKIGGMSDRWKNREQDMEKFMDQLLTEQQKEQQREVRDHV